jgi:hypothetical protein
MSIDLSPIRSLAVDDHPLIRVGGAGALVLFELSRRTEVRQKERSQ